MSFELSKKQIWSIKEATAAFNIWEGAVRSSKTVASIVAWIKFVGTAPAGVLSMTGNTLGSLERNVLRPMQDLLGEGFSYSTSSNKAYLWGRTLDLFGADDSQSYKRIQGSSMSGAYVDELTTISESYFNMLLTRLSVKGAKGFGTTNPAHPKHYIKKDHLDRADGVNMKSFHFELDDNPFISKEYKERIKQSFSGVFFKRMVKGLWVSADGAIYDNFSGTPDQIKRIEGYAPDYRLLGVDWGVQNATAFLLVGVNIVGGRAHLHVEKEYYHSGRDSGRQKSTSDYARDMREFIGDLKVRAIVIDPSACALKIDVRRQIAGVPLKDASNAVVDGIQTVYNMVESGELSFDPSCKNLTDEMYGYMWDEASAQRGEDKPSKVDDHGMDALRYIAHTFFGKKKSNLLALSAN